MKLLLLKSRRIYKMRLNLINAVDEALQDTYVTRDEMMDIVLYLMENSVICRNDSPKEEQLYDRFRQIPQEIINFFQMMRMEIHDNKNYDSIRLYAPDAEVPNPHWVVDNPSTMIRMSFSKELSAALLVCYAIYDSYSKDAKLEADFTAVVPQHEFIIAHMTMLGIELEFGRNKTMLADIYKTLKKLRAINYHKNFHDSDEYPIIIRPLVMDIVLKQSVDNARIDIKKDIECE